MSNIKSGINIFDSTSITIGDGAATDGYIYINNNSPAPYLRHNTSEWIFSNDGSTETSVGTGFTSYTIGDILYANSTTSLSKLPISNDGYVLTLSGGVPSWEIVTSGTNNHNLLSSLQGGTSSEYYHLTNAEHTWLTDGYTTEYWVETKGGTGQTTYTTGDILYADGSNSLAKLVVGSTDQVLQISGGVPTWQTLSTGTSIHNNLTGIQGGEADGYYHLTPDQHAWVVDGYINNTFSGWTDLTASEDFSTTAPDGYSITILTDQSAVLTAGISIKLVDNGTTKYYVVDGYSAGTLLLRGPLISTGSGNITALSYGIPEKTVNTPLLINAEYAQSEHTGLNAGILSAYMKMYGGLRWKAATARIVHFTVITNTLTATSGNEPIINLEIDGYSLLSTGVTLAAAQTEYTSPNATIDNTYTQVTYDSKIDVSNTSSSGYDSNSADLYVNIITVLE